MAGRYKQFDEEVALSKAMDLFWSKGYESTSLEDLLKAMDLNKGSLYNTFGNKKKLFDRAVDLFADKIYSDLKMQFDQRDNPLDVIKEFYKDMCGDAARSDFKKGCLLSNSVTELALVDSELELKATRKLKDLESMFSQQLLLAKRNNIISANTDHKMYARQLINFWNGIHVTMRIYSDPEVLNEMVDQFFSALELINEN